MAIVAFDDLFPLKANPTTLDRVFGFDSGDGKSRAFTIQSILNLIADEPVVWSEITGKPSTFAPSAHTFGSHSNVANAVDSAVDGTFIKKVGGQYTAVAVDFYGVSNPPPPDPSIDDAVRLINGTKTAQWDQAFGWGNHAGQYRPVSWVPAWGEVTGKPSTFAPAAHTLGSHSDATALAAATLGQLIRKGAAGFEAFTADYYSPTNPPPPDASVPDFVRGFTIGQFAGYEEKLLEWVGLPNGAIPAILGGVPVNSEIVGTFTENPFDPIEEAEDYEAWVRELLYLTSTKRIKAPDATEADDLATLGQIKPPLHLKYVDQAAMLADQANQKEGYAYWDGTKEWRKLDASTGAIADYREIGGAGGGGADANAVHYNVSDGKSASEKQQARTNIGALGSEFTNLSGSGTLNDASWNGNMLAVSGYASISGFQAGQNGEVLLVFNLTSSPIRVLVNSGLSASGNRVFPTGVTNQGFYIPPLGACLLIYRTGYSGSSWWFPIQTNDLFDSHTGFRFRSQATTGNPYLLEVLNASGVRQFGLLTVNGIMEVGNPDVRIGGGSHSAGVFNYQAGGSTGTNFYWRVRNSGGTQIFGIYGGGSIYAGRSSGSVLNTELNLIRRDEQRLYYITTITTAGAISDQVLTAGMFNYRFTAASDISGFANGEIGRRITIHNATASTLTLQHENASSIAANRIKLIGAADLVIPIDGKVDIEYCTGSRWELISKNF